MRVLVFGAGGPAGINVVRSLAEAGHEVVGVDTDARHLAWAEVYCNEVWRIPEPKPGLINDLQVDAVHAQAEEMVVWIADNAHALECATLCPTSQVIVLTQDKWEACLAFRRAGLRNDRVHLVQVVDELTNVARNLGYPFWIRARYGAGARGSALCNSLEEARHWVAYWQAREPRIDFLAEAYLPGRDLAWTSLWCRGELIASFGRERLEYIYPRLAPSGRTGTPTIARTVHDDMLNSIAYATVRAVDGKPHGFYSVDLREDANGYPRPTEINAGRCFTTSYLATAAGLNFMDLWTVLIGAETMPDAMTPFDSIPADLTWMRHIDCPTLLLDPDGEPITYPLSPPWVTA